MSEIEQFQAENITLKKELAAARIWLYVERQKNAKAMKQALEALDIVKIHFTQNRHVNDALVALREALAEQPAPAQPLTDEQQFQSTADKSKLETVPANGGLLPAQQEPVAWLVESKHGNFTPYIEWSEPSYLKIQVVTPLYTTPPAPAGYAKKIESLIAERDALKARLAEQPAQQEPVAWCDLNSDGSIAYFDNRACVMPGAVGNESHPYPLYTTPPAPAQQRPPNCGTGYCSCVECLFERLPADDTKGGL